MTMRGKVFATGVGPRSPRRSSSFSSVVKYVAAESLVTQANVRKFFRALRWLARQQLGKRGIFQIRGIVTLKVKTLTAKTKRNIPHKIVVATAASGRAFYDLNVNGCWPWEVSSFYRSVARLNGYGTYAEVH